MLAAHAEIPRGTIPSHMVSNGELRSIGLDPVQIRRLEDGLAGVGLGLGLTPGQIPRPQAQRVAMYEQRFGAFDSGKNAYWSLRRERPVSLAEGARFDVGMRAGQLAPVAPRRVTPRLPSTAPPLRHRMPQNGAPPPTTEERIRGIVGRILPVVPQVIDAITGRPAPVAAVAPAAAPAPFARAGMFAGMPPWLMPALLGLGALVIVPRMLGKKRQRA